MTTLFAVCRNTDFPAFTDWMISISAVLLLISNLLIFVIDSYNQKKDLAFTELQLQLQKEQDAAEYYRLLLKQNESQRILMHDIKKHLSTIAVLSKKDHASQIATYVDLLFQSPALQETSQFCDRDLLNAILCSYQARFEEQQIAFHTDIRANTTNALTDADITSLFCNLLDNALEAAAGMENAAVDLDLMRREGTPFCVLVMTNSCPANPFLGSGKQLISQKKDPRHHGYGMKSIRRIVEKHGGEMEIYYDADTRSFHTILTLRQDR